MKKTKALIILILTFTINLNCQTVNEKINTNESFAKREIKQALTENNRHNVIDNKQIIIKDSITAINIAEPILFSIYGKENIERQRPYKSYFYDIYWLICGTLPENIKGGNFLIILDSRNSKIIRLTHGK